MDLCMPLVTCYTLEFRLVDMLPVQAQEQQYDKCEVTGKYMVIDVHTMKCMCMINVLIMTMYP